MMEGETEDLVKKEVVVLLCCLCCPDVIKTQGQQSVPKVVKTAVKVHSVMYQTGGQMRAVVYSV
jgi:hypothetical protein